MKQLLFLSAIVLFFSTGNLFAAAPKCQLSASNNPYCSYKGKVKNIYINSGNLILIYFDTPVDINVPKEFGYNVRYAGATAYLVDDNPEFAKLFYSTALSAQASGRDISIQMKEVQSGYLKFDRIWLGAP